LSAYQFYEFLAVDQPAHEPIACARRWLSNCAMWPRSASAPWTPAHRTTPRHAPRSRPALAVAWQWAAEPYAPLRRIPGITWNPIDVAVQHRSARSR